MKIKSRIGWIEQVVRFLVGLPTAMAYFYVRHLDAYSAYAFLTVGMAVLVAGLLGHDPDIRSTDHTNAEKASAPSLNHYAHAS